MSPSGVSERTVPLDGSGRVGAGGGGVSDGLCSASDVDGPSASSASWREPSSASSVVSASGASSVMSASSPPSEGSWGGGRDGPGGGGGVPARGRGVEATLAADIAALVAQVTALGVLAERLAKQVERKG